VAEVGEGHENEKIPSNVRKSVLIRAALASSEGAREQDATENTSTKGREICRKMRNITKRGTSQNIPSSISG
jgi:hypothetical protein